MRCVTFAIVAVALTAGAAGALPSAPDPAVGRVVYRTCAVCHGASGEGAAAGPSLRGIIGRKAAADPDFAYSAAMKRSAKIWTQAEIAAFLLKPQAAVPGTRMAYPGAGSPDKAAALAAYLATLR